MNLEEYAILYNYLSESDSDEEESGVSGPGNHKRRQDPFTAYSEKEFKKQYRLTKDLARQLIFTLRPLLRQGSRSSDLTIETKVLTALNFFGKGCYQSSVGKHEGAMLSQGAVSNCITEVCDALNHTSIFGRWVKFPSNLTEMMAISQRFYQKYGLPGVVGCIDCTHVAIVPPPNNEEYAEAIYICDDNLKILNVNALFPGGTHDSFIWNQSNVLPVLEQLHGSGAGRYYLIGDSGYGLRPWLHTPISEPQPGPEQAYNEAFKSARATIERCNGVLKMRFRCLLKHRVLHYLPEKASKIINGCCVLHNMCITNNVVQDSDDDDDEDRTQFDFGLQSNDAPSERRHRNLVAGENFRNSIIRNYF